MGKKPLFISINKKSYIHPTTHLSKRQVGKLFKGGETAFKMGCPLNRFITIHYDDYADRKRPQKFVLAFLEHTRKWLKRRGLPAAYLYTLENGKTKGIHVHLLLHVPNNHYRIYKKAMVRWLTFEIGKPRIVFKRIQYPPYGDLSVLHGLYGTMRYICKAVEPNNAIRDIKPKDQGAIMGRRWGISKLLR